MLYLGFGQVNVLIVPVYLVQKALVLQFKLVKQLVERLIYFKPQRPLLAVRKLQNVLRMVVIGAGCVNREGLSFAFARRGCVPLFFGWFPSIVFSSVSI